MAYKHISFSESIVMRELEKIARDKGLIEEDIFIPDIKKTASNELKETGDLFADLISFASVLRNRNFIKQAQLLEQKAVLYKQSYNVNTQTSTPEERKEREKHLYDTGLAHGILEEAHAPLEAEDIKSQLHEGHVETIEEINRILTDSTKKAPKAKQGNELINKLVASAVSALKKEGQEGDVNKEQQATENIKNIGHETVANFDKFIETIRSIPKPAINYGKLSPGELSAVSGINDGELQELNYYFNNLYQNKQIVSKYINMSDDDFKKTFIANDAEVKKLFPSISNIRKTDDNAILALKQNIKNIYDRVSANSEKLNKLHTAVMAGLSGLQEALVKAHSFGANIKQIIDVDETIFSTKQVAQLISSVGGMGNFLKSYAAYFKSPIEFSKLPGYFVGVGLGNPFITAKQLEMATSASLEKLTKLLQSYNPNFAKTLVEGKINIAQAKDIISKVEAIFNEALRTESSIDRAVLSDNFKAIQSANKAITNLSDGSTYFQLYGALSSIPNVGALPTKPENFMGLINSWLADANNVKSIVEKAKKAEGSIKYESIKKNAVLGQVSQQLGGPATGAGTGAAPASTTTPSGGGGAQGGVAAGGKKIQSEEIRGMQGFCIQLGDLINEFIASKTPLTINNKPIDTKKMDLRGISNTAKKTNQGADRDGVWGVATEQALTKINQLMQVAGIEQLQTAKPKVGETQEATNGKATNNTRLIMQLLIAIDPTRYARFANAAYSGRYFDKIPSSITNEYNEFEGGIVLKNNHFNSLYSLKKYLDSKGFRPVTG